MIAPTASRFYQRWLAAAPDRAAQADDLAQLSLAQINLADYLAKEAANVPAGAPPLPLPRAMRRLRNLLVCVLIRRDLAGKANLAEVVVKAMAVDKTKRFQTMEEYRGALERFL